MLIYNFQKEFLGIDEKDLHTLGYKNLAELRTEVTDFADLFVKTPGYIHNFQHVHWIDFITCAESNEESKVIINANSKSYKAIITVTNAYLVDNPDKKAYLIHLNNLRILTTQEYDNISEDIIQRPISDIIPKTIQTIRPKKDENIVIQDEYDIPLRIEEDLDKKLEVGDLSTQIKEPISKTEPQLHVTLQKEDIVPKQTHEEQSEEQPKDKYVYDPHIASKELGLPLDLIEEFIEDFIDQANEFKNELYTALDEGNINNVKILSHKLKGVAANLRIEDAHELLSVVNTASDADIIKTNLDNFYSIIAGLSGKETLNPINDKEVPQKLEIILKEPEVETQNEEKYSKEKSANEIGLDLESFNELFEEFIKEANTIYKKINETIANNDYKTLKQLALKLKSMSDNMRIHSFTNELKILINSTDKDVITQALTKIDNILTTISKEED